MADVLFSEYKFDVDLGHSLIFQIWLLKSLQQIEKKKFVASNLQLHFIITLL